MGVRSLFTRTGPATRNTGHGEHREENAVNHGCLDTLRPGRSATVTGFTSEIDPVLCQRLQDLGVHPGAEISCLRVAPLGCPVMLRVGNADLCLRKQQARAVRIETGTPPAQPASTSQGRAAADSDVVEKFPALVQTADPRTPVRS